MSDARPSNSSCPRVETLLQGALWVQGGRGAVTPSGIRQEEHCFGVLNGRGAECGGPDQKKVPLVKDGAVYP